MMPIYTADLETDPFEKGKMIEPFLSGLYDGENFSSHWGRDCIAKLFHSLSRLPEGIVYIHNLGGFDFFWMLAHFTGETMIRESRIVMTHCKASNGFHEIRDSFAIMPFALKKVVIEGIQGKKDIDIYKLKKVTRDAHRAEIREYLRRDCTTLHYAVSRFIAEFGDRLTIGSAAMGELSKVHDFIHIKESSEDELIRSHFYYGGRVQCFKGGVIKQPIKIYDVNSMYPYVMRTYQHPITRLKDTSKKVRKDTCFVLVQGKNNGAFPMRLKDGSLMFDVDYGIFGVTIHEWKAAMELGLFRPDKIIACYNYDLSISFTTFVDKFFELRSQAKQANDETLSLFYKLILNSSYGKFAQDSSNYFDYRIGPIDETYAMEDCGLCRTGECPVHWMPDSVHEDYGVIIWKRATKKPVYYNVATGASITGAARSVLMRAIHNSDGLLYCDTDSVICKTLRNTKLSNTELGSWKLEGKGTRAAIAGKKLYAIFDGKECIKQANKGVRITARQIERLAQNQDAEYLYERESPTLSIDGSYRFLKRRIRSTVNA